MIIPKNDKLVLGYHTGWANDSLCKYYNWKALDILVYFGYEADYQTGKAKNIYRWNTTSVIDSARNNGVKTQLLVALMSSFENKSLLENPAICDTLILDLIEKVKYRNSNGISVDFESIPQSQKENFVKFLTKLRNKMTELLGKESILSIAAPAVDWNKSWDYKAISEIVDYVVMMGYDYSYSGSPNAGAVAPLEGNYYNVTKSINDILSSGCKFDKLLLGTPWYGYMWKVEDMQWGSNTLSRGTAYTYSYIKQLMKEYDAEFDTYTKTKKMRYSDSANFYQLWFDDSLTLSLKYDLVNEKNIAGIAIWAINYARQEQDLWLGILDKFSMKNNIAFNHNEIKYTIQDNKIKLINDLNISKIIIFDMLGKDISDNFKLDLWNKNIEIKSSYNRNQVIIIQINDDMNNKYLIKMLI